MDKLYSRKTRFDEVLAGKYSLPVMFMVVGVFALLPWDEWGRIPWYASLIEYQELIFPNLRKLSIELPPQRAEYFKPMVAFLNVFGWVFFVYVLSKVPVADKIASGEKKISGIIGVLILVLFGCVLSPWILTASGTHGGLLTKITRKTDYGLTMIFVFTWWGVTLLWYIFISVMLGLVRKIRSEYKSPSKHRYEKY